MQVNFYATLRPIVGSRTVHFDVGENLTVQQLIDAVVTRFPKLRQELLNDEGNLYPHVHVFVNGRDAPYLPNGVETLIQAGDTIDIFPAVAGG
ncbi:ubiquitin-like small modifier protein 1 [Roseiflexus castenholzii]|jgi:molybdopterin synthase sulfur carrier subunit|uniref:MoaD family protein n=1 Tax=Roseiflexus castenholzii (strain DSM 13941 / HLO8) TaxID=383372 RepID=A7NKD3_ROSCS|nr:ubiquitin-like small modifier protein 1 [Roseiflexus castenholzii]ABU57953.1 MoaD family protein [Roseiflexus castenholzii DSM 13941]